MTDEIITQIQIKYACGETLAEIAASLALKIDSIQKAVRQQRIQLPTQTPELLDVEQSTKSSRSIADDKTAMGKACGNELERVLASITGTPSTIKFETQIDLSCAGVLLALPALLSNGLLKHSADFTVENVYYSEESVFLCLAFLSLLRVQNLNQSMKIPCGELGRALGLDRIPEVKTLRERITQFCAKGDVKEWGEKLSKEWLNQYADLAGVMYIDGHVNVYYGQKTKMPKRFVSRLRLCMSGSTDYWVCDKTGQPFFVVNEVINSGMIAQIQTSLLPRLEKEIPNQPNEEALLKDTQLHKFMLVCDRECYSVDFFADLWEKRIAICTYNKNVKTKWAETDFIEYEHIHDDGSTEKMMLAEKTITLTNRDKENPKEVSCREIRKLATSGHQTSIITTNWKLSLMLIGVYMFARWCQENFFKYMLQNFDIDGLVSYTKDKISETKTLVNPLYRQLENEQRALHGKLSKQKTAFANTTLKIEIDTGKKLERSIAKKAEIYQEIKNIEGEIATVKEKKNKVERKIPFASLPANEQFSNAINNRKHFMDNIKMIAYRAETGMYNLIKNKMSNPDEGRKLLQQIYTTDADIVPDNITKTLTVKLHNLNHRKDDKVLDILCQQLNETETIFPGTDLTLIYKLVSD